MVRYQNNPLDGVRVIWSTCGSQQRLSTADESQTDNMNNKHLIKDTLFEQSIIQWYANQNSNPICDESMLVRDIYIHIYILYCIHDSKPQYLCM